MSAQSPSSPGIPLEIPKEHFGMVLQRYRMESDLTLMEASVLSHVRAATIQKLETGDFSLIDLNPCYCLPSIDSLCLAYKRTQEETEALRELFSADLDKFQLRTGTSISREDALNDSLRKLSDTPKRRPSAILISALIVVLVAMVLGGYAYKFLQQSRLKRDAMDYDLPSLIEPRRLPMDLLPIPAP